MQIVSTASQNGIGLSAMKISKVNQVVGIGDNTQVIGLDRTIKITILEETLEDMEDKIVEEDIEMIDIMIIIEAETGQRKDIYKKLY